MMLVSSKLWNFPETTINNTVECLVRPSGMAPTSNKDSVVCVGLATKGNTMSKTLEVTLTRGCLASTGQPLSFAPTVQTNSEQTKRANKAKQVWSDATVMRGDDQLAKKYPAEPAHILLRELGHDLGVIQ